MLHMTFLNEDHLIIATGVTGEHVDIRVTDLLTGSTHNDVLSYNEFCAIIVLNLGMGEDKTIPRDTVTALYAMLKPRFQNWPQQCIPVP